MLGTSTAFIREIFWKSPGYDLVQNAAHMVVSVSKMAAHMVEINIR
jgi:hypothetical protein